jgi:hypothetical protein
VIIAVLAVHRVDTADTPAQASAEECQGEVCEASDEDAALLQLASRTRTNSTQTPSTRAVVAAFERFWFAFGTAGVARYSSAGNFEGQGSGNLPSVDDLSIDTTGGALVSLMSFNTQQFAVVATANLDQIQQGPTSASMATFGGTAMGSGRLVMSGGTMLMSVFPISASGQTGAAQQTDLGIGQPDVTMDVSRPIAYVATDFSGQVDGTSFGITVVDVQGSPTVLTRFGVPNSGLLTFSGGSSPNFALRSASAPNVLAVVSLDALSLYDVTTPSSPRLFRQLFSGELGCFPRSVAFGPNGRDVFVVGPVDRNNPSGQSLIRALNLDSQGVLSLTPSTQGRVDSIAATTTNIALATEGGPVFLARSQLSR